MIKKIYSDFKRDGSSTRLSVGSNGFRLRLAIEGRLNKNQRRAVALAILQKILPCLPTIGIASLSHPGVASAGNLSEFEYGLRSDRATALDTEDGRFGFLLQMRRHELSLSKELMAQVLGIDRAHLSRLERGKFHPNAKTRWKVKRLLGIDYPTIRTIADDRKATR